jgi:hypothetical protein
MFAFHGHLRHQIAFDTLPVLAWYAATQELIRTFEMDCGGSNCNELLGCDIGTRERKNSFNKQELYRRCERFTLRAAENAATLLSRNGGRR